MRKPRKRNHSLYISFVVHKEPRYPMCIARLPEEFITQKQWRHLLTTIAKHYSASIYDITAVDGLCDPPGFDPDLHPFYEKSNIETFPKLETAFAGGDGFLAFDLWKWNPETLNMTSVRIKE